MRLTPAQIKLLIKAIDPFVQDKVCELRLYGSRIRDDLKGGDIDLLLLTEQSEIASSLQQVKHYMLAAIKRDLGDQKIDLVIVEKEKLNQDTFLKMIFPASIFLNSWN